jgi:nicotinate-nucleotide adenylyltransferase
MKIGILAGTFDPIHIGHLKFIDAAMVRFQIDKVLLMPEKQPRGKAQVTSFTNRIAMIRKAAANNRQLQAFDTGEKFFTLQKTLPIIEKKYRDASLVIMVGSDVARNLASWPGIDKLSTNVSFIVALRSGDSEMSVRDQLSQPAIKPRVSYVNSPEPRIAASLIRAGETKTGIAEVDRYIAERHLYD